MFGSLLENINVVIRNNNSNNNNHHHHQVVMNIACIYIYIYVYIFSETANKMPMMIQIFDCGRRLPGG